MNWKLLIANRIYRSNEGGKEVSKPAIRIAMTGIAVGLAIMIVSVAVVIGFKQLKKANNTASDPPVVMMISSAFKLMSYFL